MKQGFLIPVYNHGRTAGPIVKKLSEFGLPILLVDDGSDEETRELLAGICGECPLAVLVTLERNSGKGGAVSAGIDKAHELGLTHVLQIDADGQHDIGQAAFFLEQSRFHPVAAICSYPVYDDSVPASRKKGRMIANTMVRAVTLSGDIIDAMCGFRVYPVEPVWKLIHRHHFDHRMGFDIEIFIRLHWAGVPMRFHPVAVVYPEDGTSHYHLVRDNLRITWVFTRLFFGMVIRIPALLRRNRRSGGDGKG